MEHFESGVIGHILELLPKIVNFFPNFREKIYRVSKESEFYLEKYIK
jgi:hypothetical protein